MAQLVEVTGVGIVEFPDGMSRDDMAAALSQLPTPGVKPVAKPPETFQTQVAAPAVPAAPSKKEPYIRPEGEFGLESRGSGREIPATREITAPEPVKRGEDLGVMSGYEDKVLTPQDKTATLPLRPEVRKQIKRSYDAALPGVKKQMEVQPGVIGDIAREQAEKYAATEPTRKASPILEDMDPRAEARERRLIAAGEKPEFAKVAAERSASAGVVPGKEIQFMEREGVLEPTKFDFEMQKAYENETPGVRAVRASAELLKQKYLGLNEAISDLVGADEYAAGFAKNAAKSRNTLQSMGENRNYMGRMLEGAVTSIITQAPGLVVGAVTGTTPLILADMFVQTFGQEYSTGRAKGLDGADAVTRAGTMAAFEVMGERLGLRFAMDNIRRAVQGMPTDKLKDFLGNTLKRELPGEYFTSTGQFITDKSAVGLNKDATIVDYLQVMADTTVQTIMQSGLMTAGIKGLQYGAEKLTGKEDRVAPDAETIKNVLKETPKVDEEVKRIEPTFDERPKLTELEVARKPELEGEAAAAPLTELEGARKEEIEQTPPAEVEDPRIAAQTAYYTAQGFAADDAQMLAIQDIETATGEKITQPTGRAMQRGEAADEQRTAEGKAERAELQMEEANVPAEVPARVTEPIPDQYGYEVPSRDEQAAARLEDPFTRGLDNAADLARRSTGREERERTSLEANQKRIQSQISQAFNREAYPDLGVTLGANWTRKILATNPTPEEYQDAAYARMEELGGRLPEDAQLTKETPRVTEAPKAVEAKEERQEAPTAAPTVKPAPAALPKPLAGAKPRYAYGDKMFELKFESDIDRAAYIAAQATPSKRDADYVGFVSQNTGMSEPEVRAHGKAVRNAIKAQAKEGEAGTTLEIAEVGRAEKPVAVVKPTAAKIEAPAKPTKPAAEPAPLEMQRTRKEKLEAETPVPAQPATAVKGFAPLELEATRKEELEVEPPEVKAVAKSEAALPKVPKTRAPGGGRKVSEESKTYAERRKQVDAINQFNRDVITLMGAARKLQNPTGAFPTAKEYDYAEATRLRSLEIVRKKLYALSLVRDPKAGYIAAKSYIRKLKPAELARAKALHEGTEELTNLPVRPKATLTTPQLEKFRKDLYSETKAEPTKPRGRPKKVKAIEEKKVPTERAVGFAKEGFRPTVRGEIPYTEAEEAELRQLRKESLAPTKSYNELLIQFAKEAGVPETELQEAADTAQDISEDELNFDDVQKMSVSELARITQIAARIVEVEHSPDADFAFTKFKTLPEALEHIAKTGTALDAGIANALMTGENGKLISKVKLYALTPTTPFASERLGKFWRKEMLGAKGLYAPTNKWKNGVVMLAQPSYGHQGINNATVLHEATHAATVMKLRYVEEMVEAGRTAELNPKLVAGYKELAKLMDRSAYYYEQEFRAGRLTEGLKHLDYADVFINLKEFVAYGFTDPSLKALLHGMPGINTKKTGFSNFISGVLKLLNINSKYDSGLKDFILATGKLMEAKTPSAKRMEEVISRSAKEPYVAAMKKAKTQESETKRVMENLAAAEAGSKKLSLLGNAIDIARDPSIAGDILKAKWVNMSTPALQAWLLTMPSDVIVSVGTDAGIGNLKQTYKDMREVGAFRRRETTRVENIAKPWIALKAKEQDKLADVMLASTDLRVDPSKDQSNPTLNKMWNALTPEAKTIYNKTRDYYSTAFKLFNALAMQRIEQSGLKGSINDPDTAKGRVAQAIKDTYKAGMSIEPYFPLMREGKYWVSFGKKDNYEFQTFTNPGDRETFISERIRKNTAKGDSRTFEKLMEDGQADTGNDVKKLQEKASAASPMLQKLFASVDKMQESDMSDMGKDGLKADIFQMHLMSLPEGTFRKQFIHRKNVRGYGRDALKNFVVSGSRIAGQLARAKYAPKIDNGISAAEASIERMPNKARLDMFIRELELRGKDIVNPPVDESFFASAARFANKSIFAYTTTSIKTAVNNTFSFATNAVPTMAKYYGLDATLVEMGKFVGTAAIQVGVTRVKPDGSVTYTWPSLGSSAVVRRDKNLQEAVRRMDELDIVKQNQTFDVYVAKKGAAASKVGLAYDAFIRFTGMPFQGTERIVREATFLSAVKLGMKQGLNLEAAIDKAVMVTDEALFNYDPENMPRAMRNPIVKVLSTLKRFSYFTAIYHLRNAAQMIKPLKGETRRGAAYALFGSMGMTGLVGAGIYQAFGVSTAVGLYGMLQGLWNMINGDGDDEDKEDGLLKDLNFQRWFNTVYLPENYGDVEFAGVKLSDVLAKGLLTAASGYDFASGLSQGNLWFKDAPGASGSDNAYMNFVESIGFPILSVPANITTGIKDINEGDTLKGWEKLNPSALTRNPAVAYRYSQEGVLTGMLDTVKYADEFTAMQLFMQGLGYKSAGLAETMDMNFVIKREMARVENAKQELLKQYYKAEKRGNDDLLDKLDKRIERFNSMYPADDLAITADKLSDYIEGKDEELLESERGLEIKEKFQDFDVLRYKGLEQIGKESR